MKLPQPARPLRGTALALLLVEIGVALPACSRSMASLTLTSTLTSL